MTGFNFKEYTPDNALQFIYDACGGSPSLVEISTKRGIDYLEIPMSFDIETTSWINEVNEKRGVMYCWQFGLNGFWMLGRTWQEFKELMNAIVSIFELGKYKRAIVWVHNLKYEFQFIQYKFQWDDIFAIDTITPVQAVASCGLEFRCSYLQSGKSLSKLGESLTKYKIPKLVGDLDYSKIRHWKTELTEKEKAYCRNDVLILNAYIQELMDKGEKVSDILLTKTMYVRRDVRNACFYGEGKHKRATKTFKAYKAFIQSLSLELDEYIQAKDAFAGGFTHANARYANRTLENVTSWDFTSSYPAVMLSEEFPMSKGEKIEGVFKSFDDFYDSTKLFMFRVAFKNIRLKEEAPDTPISSSKCQALKGEELDNGRVWKASLLQTTITETDFITYRAFYDWDEVVFFDVWKYEKAYLPLPIISSIIKYYKNKTTLKDVEGEEETYQLYKGFLNSIYGMMVSAIIHDNYEWGELYGWTTEKIKEEEMKEKIEEYNNSSNRFLSYLWGVWITAYARRNLFSGIWACREDYIYSDTDSIKILNSDKHTAYIQSYNKAITAKLKAMCSFYSLNYSDLEPVTVEGVKKPIGVWDFDGFYSKFKTLGAKRYLCLNDKGLHLTLAGVNKKDGAEYLKTFKDPFEFFTDKLTIPANYSGKNTLTYGRDSFKEELTDYNGITAVVAETSWAYMESVDFNLSMTDYLEYIIYVKEKKL